MHHKHAKKRQANEIARRAVGDIVKVTIDGKLVSWVNQYSGSAAATTAPSLYSLEIAQTIAQAVPITTGGHQVNFESSHRIMAIPSATASTESESSGSRWTRQAYYNAELGLADGITFLNHFGGTKSLPGTDAGGPA